MTTTAHCHATNHPNRDHVLLFVVVGLIVLSGCYQSGIDHVGVVSYEFHGLVIELPFEGEGKYTTSTDRFEFRKDSTIVAVEKTGAETFEIRVNGELVGTANQGDHVRIGNDGKFSRVATEPR